ncbi:DNA topoisomerase III [Marinobacterium stanieri]|uniref:DNA topoisomerase 3 n=1 Tax=Marinobacterium stanieri TaxID=49186 RepID=A0A1N6UKA8_9GAMM|nr:DNA topoisomerase III [Marinobacterium stanieri]SIQ66044.1 DNA topoisomerase-3 [Marinobacterium stanieri]
MKLYIAEKPSLGRAIAAVLPGPQKKEEGLIRCGGDQVVSWCIGHLLEQVEPDTYNPAFKQWRLEHLPILPDEWQLKPRKGVSKQLSVLRKLVKSADQIIHAGDPDREGQLLVDEVIEFLKVPASKKSQVQRLLISDLNPDAVRRALQRLKSNREFVPLSVSALARSRADWLFGINMTRALTVKGRSAGYNGVLSVGRVQTPVLGLVVQRDAAIDAFVPKPFYEVDAHLLTESGERFKARWQPSEACARFQDEEGRVLSKALAENVVARITGQPGKLLSDERKTGQQAVPLPYNLSALQIDCAKRFGLNAQQVLDAAQALYEKHNLITYPRSDCRYLPAEHFAEGAKVTQAVARTQPDLSAAVQNADLSFKSKAWNDKKVEAHHAIIPTSKAASAERLSRAELQVYSQIARQYLMQFYPPCRYADRRVEVEIAGGLFVAKVRQILDPGWKALLGKEAEDETVGQLPVLKPDEPLHCERGELLEKMTQPPKAFTDASLLAAMTGIARFVQDAELRKVLRETDGLGTEATRAGIIELLFRRGFLQRQGKQIHATAAGKALIAALPDDLSRPDMTAHWESQLDAISRKAFNYQGFMQPLQDALPNLISSIQPQALSGIPAPKTAGKRRRKSSGSKVKGTGSTSRKRGAASAAASGRKRATSSAV